MFRVFIVCNATHRHTHIGVNTGTGTATYIRIQFQPILSHSSSMPWLSHTHKHKQARNHTKLSQLEVRRECVLERVERWWHAAAIQTRNAERIRNIHFRHLLRFHSFSIPIQIRWWMNDARDKKRHNDGLRTKAKQAERTLCANERRELYVLFICNHHITHTHTHG